MKRFFCCFFLLFILISNFAYAQGIQKRDQSKDVKFSVSAKSLAFTADGGTKTVTVKSAESWSISKNLTDWGRATRSGNTLSISVNENTATSERTGTIKVKSGSSELTISVTQNAAEESSDSYLLVSLNSAN